ncbi:MAG: GNAT family N-acetyltransferase, partial [Alphaproteobacteria bacterium]|nr:GNAT family N-acetyltransferase [Alphaproteobacteria bacterium]
MFQVSLEKPGDGPKIEKLLDQSFGPERGRLTAYCLRADVPALAELCFVMRGAAFLCATIRFWPVLIDDHIGTVLLGPLAV